MGCPSCPPGDLSPDRKQDAGRSQSSPGVRAQRAAPPARAGRTLAAGPAQGLSPTLPPSAPELGALSPPLLPPPRSRPFGKPPETPLAVTLSLSGQSRDPGRGWLPVSPGPEALSPRSGGRRGREVRVRGDRGRASSGRAGAGGADYAGRWHRAWAQESRTGSRVLGAQVASPPPPSPACSMEWQEASLGTATTQEGGDRCPGACAGSWAPSRRGHLPAPGFPGPACGPALPRGTFVPWVL